MIMKLLFLSSCTPPVQGPQSRIAMGTVCQINLYEAGRQDIYDRVFARIDELERILSVNIEESDLSRVNRNAGIMPVRVSAELMDLLLSAIDFAEKSGGHFDPSIGPLVNLWGIGSEEPKLPKEEEIREALSLLNFRDIELNPAESTVFLRRQGMALDLGAIAKGYAADDLVSFLASLGINRGIINLGGDIFALGTRDSHNAEPWRIGIQDPMYALGSYMGIINVANRAVTSSGVYQRYFYEEDRRYHHILSTEDGYTVNNGLLSVSIIYDNALIADALCTAAFAMGWERGSEFILSFPGAEGVFIFEDLSIRLTPGAAAAFTLSNPEYSIIE